MSEKKDKSQEQKEETEKDLENEQLLGKRSLETVIKLRIENNKVTLHEPTEEDKIMEIKPRNQKYRKPASKSKKLDLKL